MNNNDLTKKIKWLSREVLSQKQAFPRGLDRTEWATASAHGTNPDPQTQDVDFTIKVKFFDDGTTMPICQIYSSIGDYRLTLNSFNWDAGTRTATFGGMIFGFSEAELDVKAIATEEIQNITMTIIPQGNV